MHGESLYTQHRPGMYVCVHAARPLSSMCTGVGSRHIPNPNTRLMEHFWANKAPPFGLLPNLASTSVRLVLLHIGDAKCKVQTLRNHTRIIEPCHERSRLVVLESIHTRTKRSVHVGCELNSSLYQTRCIHSSNTG